jgi:hypothetical protein
MPNVLILMQVLKSQLFVDKFSQSSQWTFLDYLAGGCELNFMVAVDFTGNSLQILTLATMGDFFPYGPNAFSLNNIWSAMEIIIYFWFDDLVCDSTSIFINVLELMCILVLILVLPIS